MEFAGYLSKTPWLRELSEARERCGYATQFQHPEPIEERADGHRAAHLHLPAGVAQQHLHRKPARTTVIRPSSPVESGARLITDRRADGR